MSTWRFDGDRINLSRAAIVIRTASCINVFDKGPCGARPSSFPGKIILSMVNYFSIFIPLYLLITWIIHDCYRKGRRYETFRYQS